MNIKLKKIYTQKNTYHLFIENSNFLSQSYADIQNSANNLHKKAFSTKYKNR